MKLGEKRIDKLLSNINYAKSHTSLDRIIYALGIPGVGEETAKIIAEWCQTQVDNRKYKNTYEALLSLGDK